MNFATAFIFPGQGSQKKGMLADLAEQHPEVNENFKQASDVLGYDLWEVVQNDQTKLNQTQYTQPALLTASVALYRIWQARSQIKPTLFAGHSLGEYSALVCAEAIEFEDAVTLVSLRGQYMQEAIPEGVGAMAVILGLENDTVIEICDAISTADHLVSAVNFNSPGQVVIAGHAKAVKTAGEKMKEAGAKRSLPLPVSVPSHCRLMKSAANKLQIALDQIDIKSPKMPVIHNVDLNSYTEATDIKTALVKQLYQPVQWTQTIAEMHNSGIQTYIECGPGQVLTGLNKRILPDAHCMSINSPDTINKAISELEALT